MTWAYFPALSLLATNPGDTTGIGVARGVLGARAPRRTEKKWGGANLQGKVVSAPHRQSVHPHPPGQSKSVFLRTLGRSGLWVV